MSLVNFFQSLQGTVWQERLLFLQQNTETYRWVAVGVIVGIHLIFGLFVCLMGRKKMSMNVGALCFVPGVNILILPIGVLKSVFGAIIEVMSQPREKKSKSKKSVNDDEFDLGFSSNEDEDGIDLF